MTESRDSTTKRSDDLKKAVVAIRNLRNRVDELESRQHEPIAIIGQSCRLPGGADTPEKLWDMLREGVDATCEVPKDRWDVDAIYDPDPESVGGSYVRRGGFLVDPVDRFDPGFFGISPRETSAMDPMHRILLELAWEALEDAGIPPFSLEGSLTGVFIGMSASDYDVIQQGSGLQNIHSYRGTGTIASIASGRVSHFLGLQGPNFPVDTACSSGLVAIVLAVEQLRAGRCDLALAGSVNLLLSPESTVFLCRMRALAADGRCRTFDKSAAGYSRGEGGGMLALKRLSDAQSANDRILAVIRGVACNHDGRSSGLTVPNPAAQRKVIEAAIRDAQIDPLHVNYVEAHGTATALGDPVELSALAEVLCTGRSSDRPLLLGAIKTNIGHLEAAAGLTGVLKVVQSLTHRKIPAHLHLTELTPHVDWDQLPLRVPTELTDWPETDAPRVAGVSAFGFSGTNSHIIVEEAPRSPPDESKSRRPVELIALSGQSEKGVLDLADRYRAQLLAPGEKGIADLAFTSTVGRSHLRFRATASGANVSELIDSLEVIQGTADGSVGQVTGVGGGPIAFLFTGQGSQSPAMARELWESSPTFRSSLERCGEILKPHMDRPILPMLIDPQHADDLKQTVYTQPALFALEFSLAELWKSWGIEPSYVLGHSLGEYIAATVAGVMDLEEALPLVALRGRLMQALPQGGRMTAVFASKQQVESVLDGIAGVAIAAVNGPENVVISGADGEVGKLVERLEAQGISVSELQVSHAFHSALMEPILDEFEQAVSEIRLQPPCIPILSNVTGQVMTAEEAQDPSRWRRHIREPVQFAASMQRLSELNVNCFVEIGPHPTLAGLGMDTITGSDTLWLPSLRRSRPAWNQLAESIGSLYKSGHAPDWAGWYKDHRGQIISGPMYPFQRERYWFTDILDDTTGTATATSASMSGTATSHPLTGVELQSPALDGWVYQYVLQPRQPAYLTDHRVFGNIVVPGAVFVEMMLESAREGPGWDVVEIAGLTFERPLVISDDGVVSCQIILAPVESGQVNIKIVSAAPADMDGRWTTHARGVLSRLEREASVTVAMLDQQRAAASNEISVAEIYSQIEKSGIKYGPAFQPIVECWTGPVSAVGRAELQAATAAQASEYRIHPCLFDAGLQLLGGLSVGNEQEEQAQSTFLPSGIDSTRFFSSPGVVCWIHCELRSEQPDENEVVSDITFYNADGESCVELSGFRARRVDGSALRAASALDVNADPVYQIDWRSVDSPDQAGDISGTWLLLAEAGRVCDKVASGLEALGARCIRIQKGAAFHSDGDRIVLDPSDENSWSHVLDMTKLATGSERLRGIVHMWGLESNASESASAEDITTRLLDDCIPLVKLLKLQFADHAGMIRIVTQGATGPDGAAPAAWDEGAVLWGLLPVLQAEFPELDCRAIDLDGYADQADRQWLLDSIFGASVEDRLAFRGGEAFAPRLTDISDDTADADFRRIPVADGYTIDISQRGTLDALRYLPAPRLVPGPGEVEIRVRATGLNFRDVLNVLGMYPGDPGPPGVELAGQVTKIAPDVRHLKVGDEIVGVGSGAFGAYTTVSAAGLIRSPAGLSMEEAATIPLAFLTAEWGLAHLANMTAGDRVLIHAGAGGVGQAAIQLALAAGVEVFATAGNDDKQDFLRAQGIKHVFSSRNPSFADGVLSATNGEGVDIVLNALTGEMLQKSLDILRENGRFIELGKAELLDVEELAARTPSIRYEAFDLGSVLIETPDTFQEMFKNIADRFSAGELRPLRVRTFAAERVVEAFRFMAQARHIGKIVIAGRELPREKETMPIRADASYVVTGATGGIGRKLVDWLLDRGAGRLVLNARSAPDDETIAWTDAHRHCGANIEWVKGDIANASDTERLIDTAATNDMPIAGVWHAAGILDDGLLLDQTRERFAKVLAPKVSGAWNLHQATRCLELDHFVLFSSVASFLAGPGQSSYACGNAFLTALAQRRRRCGLPAIAIEWGAWEGPGMASRLEERERQLLMDSGMGFLTSETAFGQLDQLLASQAPSRIVADMNWSRIRSLPRTPPPILSQKIAGPTLGEAVSSVELTTVFHAGELDGMEPDELASRLQEYVVTVLRAVLGARPEQLDEDTQIGDLGFDSLMAMELRNRFEKEVGILIPVSQLLGNATATDLAADLTLMISTTENVSHQAEKQDGWVEGEI